VTERALRLALAGDEDAFRELPIGAVEAKTG
jgi:hypothetical protein